MKNSFAIITVSLLLVTGCQVSSPSSDSKKADSAKVETVPETVPEIITTADLQAPTEMKFISHEKISLVIDISLQGGGPAYLSVYSDYQRSDTSTVKQDDYTQWNPNQNTRILASSMDSSSAEHLIAIPQHIEHVLVQVWFYDGRPPVSQEVGVQSEVIINF